MYNSVPPLCHNQDLASFLEQLGDSLGGRPIEKKLNFVYLFNFFVVIRCLLLLFRNALDNIVLGGSRRRTKRKLCVIVEANLYDNYFTFLFFSVLNFSRYGFSETDKGKPTSPKAEPAESVPKKAKNTCERSKPMLECCLCKTSEEKHLLFACVACKCIVHPRCYGWPLCKCLSLFATNFAVLLSFAASAKMNAHESSKWICASCKFSSKNPKEELVKN